MAPTSEDDPTWIRLDKEIEGGREAAQKALQAFRRQKAVQVALAALIPAIVGFEYALAPEVPPDLAILPRLLIAAIAIALLVLLALEPLLNHQRVWLETIARTDSLERERYLFLADAGPYADAEDSRARLAERVDSILSGGPPVTAVAVRALPVPRRVA